MLVIVGIRTEVQDLTSQVGIGSESHCLLGQLKRILEIYTSENCTPPVSTGRKRPSHVPAKLSVTPLTAKKSHTVCVYQALSSLSPVIANFLYARPMFYVLFGLLCVTSLCVAVDTR